MIIGPNLEIQMVKLAELREQDVNAQVMQPRDFDRLTENVRERGALESVPYCSRQGDLLEIVSGHHRVRAARAAGLEMIPVIVDSAPMTKSVLRSKQLAHNFLTGHQDEAIVREMLREIEDVDDLLRTGAPDVMLPIPESDPTLLRTPHTDFDWKVVSLVFLPHQLEGFKELVAQLDGTQDLVGLAELPAFAEFARQISGYSRVKEIRSVGTTIGALARIAQERIALLAEMQGGADQDAPWIKLETILGVDAIPVESASVVQRALSKAITRGDVSHGAPWQLLEFLCADYLGGS